MRSTSCAASWTRRPRPPPNSLPRVYLTSFRVADDAEKEAVLDQLLPLLPAGVHEEGQILSFFSGIQLVTMGLLAEIMSRTYHESQDKPIYVIRDIRESSQPETLPHSLSV